MRLATICLLSLAAQVAWAGQQHDIRTLNTTEGLSDNFVTSVCQDSKGYIWMATELGVNRFNGTSFRSFYKGEIVGNETCKVACKGRSVYVASRRNGLSVFDTESETFGAMTKENGRLSANDITDVSLSENGDLWVSFYWDGLDLVRQNGHGESLVHYDTSTLPGLASDHIWTIADDGRGVIYIGHVDAGFSVFNTGSMRVDNYRHSDADPNSLPSDDVYALLPDKRGGVWVGTNNGLAYFLNGRLVRVPAIVGRVRSLQFYDDKTVWVGMENGGVMIVENAHDVFASHHSLKAHPLDVRELNLVTVQDVCRDSYGNVWVGTFGSGVVFVGNRALFAEKWTPRTKRLHWRVAWGMAADSRGRIWVGTDGGGIDVFDGDTIVAHYDSENSALTDNAILSSLCDAEGNMWFGTFECGLFFFDSARGSFARVPLSAKAEDVRCIMEWKDWVVVGSNDGLFCVDKASRSVVRHITKANSPLRDDLVRALASDANGDWWVGTFGQGALIMSPDDLSEKVCLNDSAFISNSIHQIFRDKQDYMWVATNNGLALMDKADPSKYRTYDNIAGVVTYAVAEGRTGQIWVSTNVGVSCVDAVSSSVYNFDQRDGIPRGVYRGGSVARGLDGTLYFGSENGVAVFGTDLSRWPKNSPCPRITGFKRCSDTPSDDKMVYMSLGEPIEVDYSHNIFSVEFGVPDFSFSNMVEFSYKMEGLDSEWRHAGANRETTFRNVPPGSYTYKVRTRMRGGEWMTDFCSLPIVVKPPFWLSWWAQILYASLFAGLIWLGIWLNTRHLRLKHILEMARESNLQQKELDNERVRFITNMTHELRTPLTLMLGPLEDLKNDTEIPVRESNKISLIYDSGLKLLGMINRLMDYRKTETRNRRLCVKRGNIGNVVNEIVSSYKELNRNRELSYRLHIDSNLPDRIFFDHEAVSTILNNLISNAVKHTPSGIIAVEVAQVALAGEDGCRGVRLTVSDTGAGIPESALPHIWDRYYQVEDSAHHTSGTGIGLSLVRNLVSLHDGAVSVRSVAGAGATFDVILPIRDEWENAVVLPDDPANADVANGANSLGDASEADSNGRTRLLVVEDNEEILSYVREIFQGQYDVETAINGKEGLAKAHEMMPDIIVSDIMMPEMDGTEMCQMLKQDVATSHIPIILLTAKDTSADRAEGYHKGADSYLTKPFSSSVLRSRIENLLESRRLLAQRLVGADDHSSQKAEIAESVNRIDAEFLDKVTTIINDNIENENIDVDFIGGQVGMSHSTFYRKIKALTGMTANEFLRKIKMRNAERLLLTQRYTVAEVSYMVGISSVPYFRQCFKDEFGLSPSAYVKHKTGGESL